MLVAVDHYEETDMNGEQVARELGELKVLIQVSSDKIDHIGEKLDDHIQTEEDRLKAIEHQLSFARFLWFAIKAVGLTVFLLFTLKVGDISGVWKAMIK